MRTRAKVLALALFDAIEPYIPAMAGTLAVCILLALYGAPGWALIGLGFIIFLELTRE